MTTVFGTPCGKYVRSKQMISVNCFVFCSDDCKLLQFLTARRCRGLLRNVGLGYFVGFIPIQAICINREGGCAISTSDSLIFRLVSVNNQQALKIITHAKRMGLSEISSHWGYRFCWFCLFCCQTPVYGL